MKIFLTVLGIILLVIVLLLLLVLLFALIPVTLKLSYIEGKFEYQLRVLGIKITVPTGKKKKVKTKDGTPSKTKKEHNKLLDGLSDVRRILPPLVKRAASAISVKDLRIKAKISTDDPCNTAIIYGTVNAAVYATLTFVQQHIKVHKKDISVVASYEDENSSFEFDILIHTVVFKIIHALILLSSDGIIELPQTKQ
ncbi:MAG: DUF2953 domain-containing protein [Clostridia bacterium]|nr:DUF2953 domain-containing protein [Clostridia bacterium]